MKALTVPVTCSVCGKTLRATERLTKSMDVRKHTKPDGSRCTGHLFGDHKRVG